jgi:uncharacterized membrane protein YdjX (TVP38/TMEM64 family)
MGLAKQRVRKLAGLAIAASLGSADAFTSHPFCVTCRKGHCLTFQSLLGVSKSRVTERQHTASSVSKKDSIKDIPFFQRIVSPGSSSNSHQVKEFSNQDQLDSSNDDPNQNQSAVALVTGAIAFIAVLATIVNTYTDFSLAEGITWFHQLVAHPKETLEAGVDAVQAMGPAGVLVFGLIYCVAEILAVPATPLTLSAGYLFGVVQGTAIVLLAATCAASVAFVIGKTFLRTWVEETLIENPKFAKLDKAIGKEGFKLLLLVRLSPLFPFALSNYLYGASSIDFASYFWGTLLGFAPGTVAYVYTGMVGKALTLGGGDSSEPWYVYAGGLALFATFLKLASDVASEIVEAIDHEEEQ